MPISTPPLDYKLDREGTSGISVGPGLTILDWSENYVPSETVGRICVRGEPVFPGYLRADGTYDKSAFNSEGWFDTGDLGYIDDDGYLFITGRSKEVINRGGELISPFEVENAVMAASLSPDSPISGRVSQVLAFSACHDVLQEVVAVALVTPSNKPRIDLRALQSSLHTSLQQVKWPVLIVYMDDLPKKNNKVLRIKLAERLSLPVLTDKTSSHWEATCPPHDSSVSVPIHCTSCSADVNLISTHLMAALPYQLSHYIRKAPLTGSVEVVLAPQAGEVFSPPQSLVRDIKEYLFRHLHGYMVPEQIRILQSPFPLQSDGVIDEAALQLILDKLADSSSKELDATTQGRVAKAFAEVLSLDPLDIDFQSDFFAIGGDSLKAGRLLSLLRAEFSIQLPVSSVFTKGTVVDLAAHIDKVAALETHEEVDNSVGCDETYSSTNPMLMAIQLVPMVVLYPLRRATQWTIFIVTLSQTPKLATNDFTFGRLLNLVLCLVFAQVVVRFVAPFIGIAAKWTIIGRYKAGLHPMWGWYHTRWWLVDKILAVCGKGFFSFNDASKTLYCRLMGAKVGKNVKLTGASLGEWDLLDIGDGVCLNHCTCRPFAAEGNTSMYLQKIVIGAKSTVGTASIISAGSIIPPNTCIGPNSSSWEMEDASEENRELSSTKPPEPHWALNLLLTTPLCLVAWILSLSPWATGLYGMVAQQSSGSSTPLRNILTWFTGGERIAYHYLALILRTLFSPFILFFFAVAIRAIMDFFFGALRPMSAQGRGAILTWRSTLLKSLLPVSRLHDVTGMFGQHYEATSIALRMLGAKVGKRVYWPGTGPSIGDYHLLDVGNDVVFGSRAHFITSDGTSSEKITVRDQAMIADRVCLLPGVEIGEKTIMGSGALTHRGASYPAASTYVGSKGGDAVCLSLGKSTAEEKSNASQDMYHKSSEETLAADRCGMHDDVGRSHNSHVGSEETLAASQNSSRKQSCQISSDIFPPSKNSSPSHEKITDESSRMSPFGRAFYLNMAPYRVMGPVAIFCYSCFFTVFTAFYWNVPSITSIQLVDYLLDRYLTGSVNEIRDIAAVWAMSWIVIAIFTTAQAILALAFIIISKWVLLGRRKPGNFDWDKSPYCQRWQLFLCIEKLRRHCYRGHGILGFLTGTHWIVLYFKALGATIGKDCALFANGRPSLMFTEPDLITLGQRVNIDDASVVAHINSRGKFDLNRLEIGDRCVLRTGSRLLSGAKMENDSCLLEHTLIMGGDVVRERWTMQGWPAGRYLAPRTS